MLRVLRVLGVCGVMGALAWAVAPPSPDPNRVVIPDARELDALQETLLIRDGIIRLRESPARYYDTNILAPDHHQLRTTEPFLGFALLGLPLQMAGLPPTRVFEALRWLIVLVALLYAWRLLVAFGVPESLAVSGALVCVFQPALLGGFERLQVLTIPLVLAIVHHGWAVWRGSRIRVHQAGLCIAVLLYPLTGVYNALILAVSGLLLLPLMIRMLLGQEARQRLISVAAPMAVAVVCAALMLWPWLTDRADMAPFQSDGFLAIKHWYATPVPAALGPVAGLLPPFIIQAFVAGLVAACGVWQWRTPLPTGTHPRVPLLVLAWLGGLACVWSFGPAIESNASPFGTGVLRGLMEVVTPLKGVREFDRFWPFGVVLLSAAGVGAAGQIVRRWSRPGRLVLAAVLITVALWPLTTRVVALTRPVEAPDWFVDLAGRASGEGPIYVHPLMQWNTPSCVLLPDAAHRLRRSFVNGCLGVMPPWFAVATEVLHRFPDPEARWLLDRWGVHAVVDLETSRPAATGVQAMDDAEVEWEADGARVWRLAARRPQAHPSSGEGLPTSRWTREAASVRPAGEGMVIAIPADALVWAVELEFSMDAIVFHGMPRAVTIARADEPGVPLASPGSGDWLQSLAADALLRREAPLAVVALDPPVRGSLVVSAVSGALPLARVVWLGERVR